jgi:hypothetical protein
MTSPSIRRSDRRLAAFYAREPAALRHPQRFTIAPDSRARPRGVALWSALRRIAVAVVWQSRRTLLRRRRPWHVAVAVVAVAVSLGVLRSWWVASHATASSSSSL